MLNRTLLGFAPALTLALLSALLLAGPALAAEPLVARLAPLDKEGTTFRLYEGLTVLVHNPGGKAFKLALDVRDLNLIEPGPRELLFKVYDPNGKSVVREIIPDDGVITPASQSPTGGWDHEGWYYLYQYNRGTPPMLKWGTLTAPDRLAAIPVRTLEKSIPAGTPGIYRVVLVGSRDHVVTVKVDSGLSWGVAGNPFYLHPVGDFFKKRFVYVPAGTRAINIAMVEHDRPRARKFTLKDTAGNLLAEGSAAAGVGFAEVKPTKPGKPGEPGEWDDKVLVFELADAPNACMVQFAFITDRLNGPPRKPPGAIQAFYASDEATARALGGGVVFRDGNRFANPLQLRLYEWTKKLTEADLAVVDGQGKPVETVKVQNRPDLAASPALDIQPNRNKEFVPLNGPHEQAPLSDTIMFSYDLHHNRQSLNVAIKELELGLRTLGPGDHPVCVTWKGMGNLAYIFGTYNWHWWRSSWRILQEKDTPAEVKELVREMIINAADRLAFCRNWERVNGNAFSTVVCGLRYACEGTKDPLNEASFQDFYDRFTTGGFGARVGVGPSGPVQEEFAYDNHYGSYPVATWGCVVDDLKDPRFIKVHDRLRNFYSYTQNDEVAACPFSARTFHNPSFGPEKEGPFAWKGLPGPDFTETVNGGNEFFAARRKGYYMLTYHGRMTPKWQNDSFMGQLGWSGGVICQVVVPGKGTVLASTLNGPGYGKDMHPTQWPIFHIHSLVGTTAEGKPLISSDCEQPDARLEGNVVTGSGEVRESSVHSTRSYTYNPDHIVAEVKLRITDDDGFQGFWFKSPWRGHVAQAWEMIPFLPNKKGTAAATAKPEELTSVKVLDAAGKEVGPLEQALVEGQVIVIDRGGFGVRIELEKPMKLKRGLNNTVMIQVIAESPLGPREEKVKPNAEDAALRYKIVPFGA
ncbi:MAG: hypothetical protein NTW19_22725 [Planctomycetota bacterium]|nr:hypothetical protein [Planctomycetota bacterium]